MALFQKLLLISGIVTEVLLIGVVSMRGGVRKIPTFVVYLYWIVLSDLTLAVCYYRFPSFYLTCSQVQNICEGLIVLAVFFDLARAAVEPLSGGFSRGVLVVLGFVTVGVGGIIWELSDSWVLLARYTGWHLLLRERLTFSLLSVLVLLLIGGIVEFLSRHFLPVGWGERELQIATGMGVYVLASLAENLATTYQRFLTPTLVNSIAGAVGVVYEFCLLYWLVCFLRPNRESPQPTAAPAGSQSEASFSPLWKDESRVTSPSIRA